MDGQPNSPVMPAAQAAGPQGQPPSGSSPATQPVANQGQQAKGLAVVNMIVRFMEMAVPLVGAGSEIGRDLLKSLSSLAKHIPPGSASPGVEQQAMASAQNQQRQMAMIQAAQAQRAQQAQAPAQVPPQMAQAA